MKICYLYSNRSTWRESFIQSLTFGVTLVNLTNDLNYDISNFKLVLFDEPKLCDCIEKKNCFSVPVVYCMLDQKKPIKLFPNLYRILIYSPFVAQNIYGLPPEIYLNYWPFIQNQDNQRCANIIKLNNILHIPSQNDKSLYSTRTLIKIFNQFSQYKLTIYYNGDPSELQPLCNPNITVYPFPLGNIDWHHFQVLIGSEEIAVNGLVNDIPVIVVGLKGIGGLVTLQNIKSFINFRFEGRNGGETFEYIPPKILLYELDKMNNSELYSNISNNSSYLRNHLSYCYSDDKILSKFQEIICICKNIKENKYESIFPTLSRNIRLVNKNGSYYLVNYQYGTILGKLDSDAGEWLKKFNGKTSLKELTENFTIEESLECDEFIKDLWNKKSILISSQSISI